MMIKGQDIDLRRIELEIADLLAEVKEWKTVKASSPRAASLRLFGEMRQTIDESRAAGAAMVNA